VRPKQLRTPNMDDILSEEHCTSQGIEGAVGHQASGDHIVIIFHACEIVFHFIGSAICE
jgi:hypothetical protein